jgi:dihydrofolate synthase/folylpolyglutamate synthase
VVSAPQADEVVPVLERAAARARVPLVLGGRDWTASLEDGRLIFRGERGLLDLPPSRHVGAHQVVNAGTAIAALEASGLDVPVAAIERGLTTVDWPARMQRLTTGALVDLVPGAEVWLDGGHNPGAGEVIAGAFADLARRAPRPLVLVAGMLETKDPVGFFRPFAGLAGSVACVPVAGDHPGRPPQALAEAARAAGLAATVHGGVAEALRAIAATTAATDRPRILICGSLHLAGEVLRENGTEVV